MLEQFKCEVMDWTLFQHLAETTARKIIESGYEPDFLIGLARGGWVLSRVLCDFLGIKDLVSLKVEHWGITATPNGKAQIKYPFRVDLSGRRALIVDDITDTGQSMIVATDYVNTLNPLEVKSAALLHITGSEFTPDFYGQEISWRWIIFPWNYIEDMCNIIKNMVEKGTYVSEIKERLRTDHMIDISENEINEIRREIKRRFQSS